MRILVAEDDEMLASGLLVALKRGRHTVEYAKDGLQAVQMLQNQTFDLLILDLGLPRLDGLEVLKKTRQSGYPLSVLILSARDGSKDRVQGLDLGADDYLTKPFDVEELLARIRALERRRSGFVVDDLNRGDLRLDLTNQIAYWCDRPVELQRKEFLVLKLLVENPQRVFSRAQIEEAVYGWNAGVESNAVDVYVHSIRKKVSPNAVVTVRGIGYRVGHLDAFKANF
jgi:two-component system response regulator QseB